MRSPSQGTQRREPAGAASAITPSGWLERLILPWRAEAFLVLVSLLVYGRSLWMDFVYDDHATLADLPGRDLLSAFTTDLNRDHGSNLYRPVSALWNGVLFRLAGTNAALWHFGELLLHVVCVLLFFRLASELLRDRRWGLAAAAIFALHPAHVEAITWASDAADLLMAICVLAAGVAFLRWLSSGHWGWWLAMWLAACGCCFSKESGIVMPALLLVLALWPGRKVATPSVVLTALGLAGTSFAYFALRSAVLQGFSHAMTGMSTAEMLTTEPSALGFYLTHLLFPFRLGPYYSLAVVHGTGSAEFLLPLLLLIVLVALAVWGYRRLEEGEGRPLWWFCAVWLLAPLAAPLYLKVFVAFELVHDRFLYLPVAALAVALAAGLRHLERTSFPLARKFVPPQLLLALLLAAFAVESVAYQGVWQDDEHLFTRAIELAPRNDRAMVNLGVTRLEQGNAPEGIAMLRRALEIQPNNAMGNFDLGNALWKNNDPAAAEPWIEKAVALEARPKWLVTLGNVRYDLDKYQASEAALRQALSIDPMAPAAHGLLGAIAYTRGDLMASRNEFMLELQGNPQDTSAMRGLQMVEARLGQR